MRFKNMLHCRSAALMQTQKLTAGKYHVDSSNTLQV